MNRSPRPAAPRISHRRYMSWGEDCRHPANRAIAPGELMGRLGRIMRWCNVCKRLIDCGPESW